MSFSDTSTKKRNKILAERKEQQELEQRRRAGQELDDYNDREFIKVHFGELDENIAWALWQIAKTLTDRLIVKYESGESELSAADHTWSSFFLERVLSATDDSQYVSPEDDKLRLIYQMARMYNDIGQTFEVEHLPSFLWDHKYKEARARVTATAPLPY